MGSANEYNENKIQTLSAMEHIRLRPGMYIGRLGNGDSPDDGIYVLLKEVIDNSMDEFIMGHGSLIEVDVEMGRARVRDFGRGIPLGKLRECVSVVNTGAKYNSDVFQFSVGLNGIGTKAVNALSDYFIARSFRDGKMHEVTFSSGQLVSEKEEETSEPNGTFIEFIPDKSLFPDFHFKDEIIEERLRGYSYLNPGIKIEYKGQTFYSQEGLLDLLLNELGEDEEAYPIAHIVGQQWELAFTHTSRYSENYFSYVNGQHTTDGGTHVTAFKDAFVKAINSYGKTSFSGADTREGLVAALSVKVKEPLFESQTKNKLGNAELRSELTPKIKEAIEDYLYKNSDLAKKIIEKIAYNEKLRKELSAVKKEAKAASKKASFKIPKLKDCRYHVSDGTKGENTMIFVTEGDSATGPMVTARNAAHQAIFSLRGKPQNVYGKTQVEMYRNEELYNLMMALGIEVSVDNLRYEKIIIATDADTDGFHIRNLILTYFLTYFEELIQKEKIFILDTPLFRVRDTKQTLYCYTTKEKMQAQRTIKNAEVTRFKGLGEISPHEFKQFIGPDMHISKVTLKTMKEIPEMLNFYMGKNTPSRREYIVDNLI